MFSQSRTLDAPAPLTGAAVRRGAARHVEEAAATVEAVMAAGRELVERDGVLDFNMRELLSVAGVSNRAFYRHFPTKDALVAALVDEVYATMVDTLGFVVDSTADPVAALEQWIDGALVYATDPALASRGRVFVAYEARLREEHSGLYRAAGARLTEQVAGLIERGRADGRFAAAESQARFVTRLVVATLQHHVLERSVPSPDERDALVDFVLGALGAPNPSEYCP